MSILSPTTALLSALVPMTYGFIRGEALSPWVYPALGLALVAVVLVGFVPDERAIRPTPTALAMAIGSGVLIGLFYIFIDLAPDTSGITPLVANRLLQFTLVGVIVVVLVLAKGRQVLVKPTQEPVAVDTGGLGVGRRRYFGCRVEYRGVDRVPDRRSHDCRGADRSLPGRHNRAGLRRFARANSEGPVGGSCPGPRREHAAYHLGCADDEARPALHPPWGAAPGGLVSFRICRGDDAAGRSGR